MVSFPMLLYISTPFPVLSQFCHSQPFSTKHRCPRNRHQPPASTFKLRPRWVWGCWGRREILCEGQGWGNNTSLLVLFRIQTKIIEEMWVEQCFGPLEMQFPSGWREADLGFQDSYLGGLVKPAADMPGSCWAGTALEWIRGTKESSLKQGRVCCCFLFCIYWDFIWKKSVTAGNWVLEIWANVGKEKKKKKSLVRRNCLLDKMSRSTGMDL